MKSWQQVGGFFNYPHVYDEAILRAKDGDTIVEVGSWLGQSMAYHAQNLTARKQWKGRLVAVDTFRGETNQPAHYSEVEKLGGSVRPAFEQNMKDCGVAEMIEVIEGDSALSSDHFTDGECSFVFIDAAHDTESVVRDILAWLPKMKPGGVIAGHDYQAESVYRAVYECLAAVGYYVSGPCWLMQMPLNTTPAQWREGIEKGKQIRAAKGLTP